MTQVSIPILNPAPVTPHMLAQMVEAVLANPNAKIVAGYEPELRQLLICKCDGEIQGWTSVNPIALSDCDLVIGSPPAGDDKGNSNEAVRLTLSRQGPAPNHDTPASIN